MGWRFMFGSIPTQEEVKNFINLRTVDADDSSGDSDFGVLDNVDHEKGAIMGSDAIKNGADVDYNGNAVKVNGTFLSQLTEQNVDDIIESNDTNFAEREVLPEDVEADNKTLANLQNLLGAPVENNYPKLTEFWDNEIQLNKENRSKLAENGINTLDDFVEAYENGFYTDEDNFIDQIKKCNL